MLKNATHVGEVVVNGEATMLRLKESPKSWSDGRRRWKKFDHRGEPITDPVHYPRGRYSRGRRLITATIRRLTVSDMRDPLAKAVVDANSSVEYHAKRVSEAEEALDKAVEKQQAAVKALSKYDKKHGTGTEPSR